MSKRFLFLHQVKASGKTIEKFLLRKYAENFRKTTLLFPEETNENIFKLAALRRDDTRVKELNAASVVTGHFPFGLHKSLEGDSEYFTIIRDPIDRIRSYYVYSLHNVGSPIHKYLTQGNISFDNFVNLDKSDVLKSGVHELNYILENGQTKVIAGQDVLVGQKLDHELLSHARDNIANHFGFVGVTEHFNDSFYEICKLMGLGRFNIYITQNKAPAKVEISADARRVLVERNQCDIELHKEHSDNLARISRKLEHRLVRQYINLGNTIADLYVKARAS